MRKEFLVAESFEKATGLAPWACKVLKVEGGYRAYESIADYDLDLKMIRDDEPDYELPYE